MNLAIEQFSKKAECTNSIGRFEILKTLGKGAQGVVYLARDPDLERKVAIKTLDQRRTDHTHLLHEARNVSQLEHPNIIPIYEIGVHEQMPYLVYQYCDGQSLRKLLVKKDKLAELETIKIICHLLDGIGYAHRNGIVHRDLNPANIMIDKDNVPRIMDFGISIMMGTASSKNNIVGTVNYMAPELLANSDVSPSVDIFAIGLILHEMLTGRQVFTADSSMAVMFKITNENILPPSSRVPSIDKELDDIVIQAVEKDPSKRFEKASEMKASLEIYSRPDDSAAEVNTDQSDDKSTVQFLLRRMKRKRDFPAISTNITQINKKTSSRELTSASELSNVILKDFALTTKLLRLVNTCFYGQFGGEITTISRAVIILGFEQVRAAALSIILFEHLNNPSQAKELKNASCSALMSGIIARAQAKKMSQFKEEDVETVFIASMFHKLGRLLSIYYLPEEYDEIKSLISNRGLKEHQAAVSVLGASYEDLGRGIAKDWQLPGVMTNSMRKLPGGPLPAPKSLTERISQLASFSNELCEIGASGGNTAHAMEELSQRYGKGLKLSVKGIKKLVENSKDEIKEFTKILNIDIENVMPFRTKNSEETGDEVVLTTTKMETNHEKNDSLANAVSVNKDENNEPSSNSEVSLNEETENHQDILIHGIAEITNSLLEDYNLNDVLTMVLETIYRGMGFTRVIFCIFDNKNQLVIGRFGLGKDIDEIVPNFRCKISTEDNIFVSAVKKNKESVILDTDNPEHKHQIPTWLRNLTMPRSVVIYPIILNKRCLGLIYADTDESSTQISMEKIRFFKTLRNQATLAIQQKQMK